jgi:hypothetical protein
MAIGLCSDGLMFPNDKNTFMPNRCNNRVMIIGTPELFGQIIASLKDQLANHGRLFDGTIEVTKDFIFSDHIRVVELNFDTRCVPPTEILTILAFFAFNHPELTILHYQRDPYSGFRGAATFTHGELCEMVKRCYGPGGDEFYNESHPMPDLFREHLPAGISFV